MICPLATQPAACFAEHRKRLLTIRYPHQSVPCQSCGYARQNAIEAYVPEEDTPIFGPKPQPACRNGHLRTEYGRRQTRGRDRDTWACKECERIARERRAKQVCNDCGKRVSPGAKQCRSCIRKEKKAAQVLVCTAYGCKCKAWRRDMCHTHYWRDRNAKKKVARVQSKLPLALPPLTEYT